MNSNTTFGVDLCLIKMCSGIHGKYIDIGCWKPIENSNTYGLYLAGWNGMCIDPNTDFDNEWLKERPLDRKVNFAAGKEGIETFYLHDYSLANGFRKSPLGTIVREKKVNIIPLKEIMRTEWPIEVLSIDAEGSEMDILESNDWELYRPNYIAIEEFDFTLHRKVPEIGLFLNSKGYTKMFDYWTDGVYVENKKYGEFIY